MTINEGSLAMRQPTGLSSFWRTIGNERGEQAFAKCLVNKAPAASLKVDPVAEKIADASADDADERTYNLERKAGLCAAPGAGSGSGSWKRRTRSLVEQIRREHHGPDFGLTVRKGGIAALAESTILDIKPVTGTAEAQWFVQGLDPVFETVCGLLPSGFEAYARILHPAWRVRRSEGRIARDPVRWAEVAEIRGTVAHRLMQWPQVWALPAFEDPVIEACVEAGLAPIAQPDEGTLPPEVAYPLIDMLGGHTGATDLCFFGVWHGFGWKYREGIPKTKRISTRVREWDLFRAPLEALALNFFDTGTEYSQSPNVVWPEDRCWCLVTDVDLSSTYLGGPETLIGQVIRHEFLEAYKAVPSDCTYEDTENPPAHQRRYRLGMIVQDGMTRLDPIGTRVLDTWRRWFSRLIGRKVLTGGRVIGSR